MNPACTRLGILMHQALELLLQCIDGEPCLSNGNRTFRSNTYTVKRGTITYVACQRMEKPGCRGRSDSGLPYHAPRDH